MNGRYQSADVDYSKEVVGGCRPPLQPWRTGYFPGCGSGSLICKISGSLADDPPTRIVVAGSKWNLRVIQNKVGRWGYWAGVRTHK